MQVSILYVTLLLALSLPDLAIPYPMEHEGGEGREGSRRRSSTSHEASIPILVPANYKLDKALMDVFITKPGCPKGASIPDMVESYQKLSSNLVKSSPSSKAWNLLTRKQKDWERQTVELSNCLLQKVIGHNPLEIKSSYLHWSKVLEVFWEVYGKSFLEENKSHIYNVLCSKDIFPIQSDHLEIPKRPIFTSGSSKKIYLDAFLFKSFNLFCENAHKGRRGHQG
ncbi:hypothetical protein BJ684DRAFT_16239 [Piptocephalis cylindrospora]|uniref:Uncharacterized protein n=1 Tax=Piptocephalis cylindrospora TaxID=1907219 RepID=A0A4P9Y691_9FUNG|nr:hypothetical protein BJ684DRAFT_16500 [Piptocephalis cylindrospora]RKP13350.1 hypothetical protein BJ684DRAFT_16239 [Piptocephalis cylindrospora]|eukprot:RKP13059.1 hypothetical protein BJ684DRAFT_16500 [Piptocephalis cylindrospora]